MCLEVMDCLLDHFDLSTVCEGRTQSFHLSFFTTNTWFDKEKQLNLQCSSLTDWKLLLVPAQYCGKHTTGLCVCSLVRVLVSTNNFILHLLSLSLNTHHNFLVTGTRTLTHIPPFLNHPCPHRAAYSSGDL